MSFRSLKLFFPDSVHFHERNFKSLFGFITHNNIFCTTNTEINSWVAAYGNYDDKQSELDYYLDILKNKDQEQIFNIKYNQHLIWKIARAELLSYYLPIPAFNNETNQRDDIANFKLMLKLDEVVTLNCFAAAMYFIDYWTNKLKDIPVHNFACIFSGSQIYNRSLIEVLKHSQTEPVIFEHFFTGNEYYCEHRYSPIANDSDIKLSNHSIADLSNNIENDRNRIKAINKVLTSNNRNVKKTGKTFEANFVDGAVITLVGQVVNDFSIIETATNYLNSIAFYKEFISKTTARGNNVIFKAHPWERHKNNLKKPFTLESLSTWVNNELTHEQKQRIIFTESADIDCLFKQSDMIVGLCSQGLLEAAFEGFKPIQFGNAFFAKQGFTHDFLSIDQFIEESNQKDFTGILSLSEYKAFESFMVTALQVELVSVHPSGISTLKNKLKPYPLISLIDTADLKDSPVIEKAKKVLPDNAAQMIPNKSSTTYRKILKLKKDPKSFLKDSKFKFFRAISKAL